MQPISPGQRAGAGIVGSQLGLNGFAAAAYPTALRSTGVGWALGIGRLGGILGPILGGALLGLGFSPAAILLSVCAPGALTAMAILVLDRIRHDRAGAGVAAERPPAPAPAPQGMMRRAARQGGDPQC